MKVSPAGRAAITSREGHRLSAYQDVVGVWTIGVGHASTGIPPHPHQGMTITEAECDTLLAADLAPVEGAINALGAKLTQNQFDACASLIFNIGSGAFAKSTVAARLRQGNMAGAADAFLNWIKPEVLKPRREAERRQFLTPDAKPVPVAVVPPVKHVDLHAASFVVTGQSFVDADKASTPVSAPIPAAAKPAAPAAAIRATPSAAQKAPAMSTAAPATKAAATASASHNVLADMISGVETKIKDAVTAVTSGTAAAAGATSTVTAAIGSVSNGVDAAKHVATLALNVRSGNFSGAAKDAEAILSDLGTILGKFGISLPLLTEANSLLVKYVG